MAIRKDVCNLCSLSSCLGFLLILMWADDMNLITSYQPRTPRSHSTLLPMSPRKDKLLNPDITPSNLVLSQKTTCFDVTAVIFDSLLQVCAKSHSEGLSQGCIIYQCPVKEQELSADLWFTVPACRIYSCRLSSRPSSVIEALLDLCSDCCTDLLCWCWTLGGLVLISSPEIVACKMILDTNSCSMNYINYAFACK